MYSISTIFDKLELTSKKELFIFDEKKWIGIFPQKIEYALLKIKPYAFFAFNSEPLILFFDFSLEDRDEKLIHKQCWNFNKSPVIISNNNLTVTVYNGFDFDKSKNSLKKLSGLENIEKFDYWNIVTGELWNEYQQKFKKENRVDYKLLKNIEVARNELINPKNGNHKLDKIFANRLIGRLIFTRYLIDRRVDLRQPKSFEEKLSKDNLPNLISNKDLLYDFFEILKEDFNGDLFPLTFKKGNETVIEKDEVEQHHLKILANLFSGNNVTKRQLSLFNIFDFDIIPVEFVSNVYEYFLGNDTQKSDKAFYTPPFLVDYILSQTVIPYFEKNKTTNCRVLDPSCGSGIFLVETFRLIVAQFEKYNPQIVKGSKQYKTKLKKLLTENIFGIDKNPNAIEIAIFSLYITMLDFFEEPKNIKGFQFPKLLGSNFFEADFFDTNAVFNDKLSSKKPNFILGNPPWGKINDSPYLEYIKSRSIKEETKITISNKQIAQAFMLRVSDFCTTLTVFSLIVSSKILYNHKAKDFRSYFLDKFNVKEVLEISPVRKLVFAKAVGPAAILTYQYANGQNTDDNFIEHIALKPNPFFALFKSILIEKYDYKEVKQSYFKEYDWIWKVLVYGSVLDFYFLKRLLDEQFFPMNLLSLIKEENLLISTGVTINGGDKNDASHLIDLPYIDNNKKDLQRFYVNFRNESKWVKKVVHRPRNPDLFKHPILLIKNGLNKNLELITSTVNSDVAFTNNITGIKSYKDSSLVKTILGILTSKLIHYIVFNSGSSTGIEREQIMFEELHKLPIVISSRVEEITQNLLNLHSEKYQNINDNHYDNLIQKAEKELNEHIYDLYQLNDKEKSLLKYATEISIPVFQQGSTSKNSYKNFRPYEALKLHGQELENYTQILLDYYSKRIYNQTGKYLQATIYCTKNIVAINFEFQLVEPTESIIWKTEGKGYLDFLATTAFQKVSSRLFIQKDIKGIRNDSFYVLKPNQYKLWHKAIAHLDILEFDNKMINLNNTLENAEI